MSEVTIRVVAAVLHPKGSAEFIPAIRFVDPDDAENEFFSVAVSHLESLIAGIRKSAAKATACADEFRASSPAEQRLLVAEAEGQA